MSSDDWTMAVITGSSSSAASIRIRVGMLSGPYALKGLSFFMKFSTPSLLTRIRLIAQRCLPSSEVSSFHMIFRFTN